MQPVRESAGKSGGGRRVFRGALRVLFGMALVCAALFFLVALKLARGLPDSIAERIGEAVSTDELSVEPAHVSFSVFTMSLRMGAIKVFRKHEVSEPLASAKGVVIRFLPKWRKGPETWVSSVKMDSLELAIDISGNGDDDGGPLDGLEGVELPDVPSVSFGCARLELLGFRMRDVAAELSCSGNVLSVSQWRVRFPEEDLAGQELSGSARLLFEEPEIRAEGRGRFDPNLAGPVLRLADEGEVADEIARFSFSGSAPAVDLDYKYCPSRRERKLGIRIDAASCSYSGVELKGLSTALVLGDPDYWGRLRADEVAVYRDEGTASAKWELAPREDKLVFSGVSSIDPAALAVLVGAVDAGTEIPVSFPASARASAHGTLSLGPLATNDIAAAVTAPAIEVSGARLSDATAAVTFSGDRLSVEDFRAKLFEGDFSGRFSLVLPELGDSPTNMPVQIAAELKGASHEAISRYRHPDEAPSSSGGTIDASLSLDGPLDDIVNMAFAETTGSVALDATDVRIYRIPIFAGLTDVLASLIPGVDWLLDADRLTVRGELGGGKLDIVKFGINGTVASLSGKGSVYFPDCEIDLKVKGHLLNRTTWLGEGVYWLLSPLSKMLEIRATGTASDPKWSSATFQSNPSTRK